MILRKAVTLIALQTLPAVFAKIAPEITTLADGSNILVKLPCVGCPFLYQEYSSGQDAPWKTREDGNVFLLNISLPLDSAFLAINNAALLIPSQKILPKIYATQVLHDLSPSDLSTLLETNLDSPTSAPLALSYSYSLSPLQTPHSSALLFHFDIFEAYSDLHSPPITISLRDPGQKVLEIVFLEKPLLSPGDPIPSYEIIRADLVPRPASSSSPKLGLRTMHFHDWDAHGRKGTPGHLVSSASDASLSYITSGVWSLFLFIMAVIGLFVVLCLFCIFGCCGGFGGDEYERAQSGKKRGVGARDDAEKGRGKGRFLSPEEMGLRSGARVVGVGKRE